MKDFFFCLLYDYYQTAEISFIWRAILLIEADRRLLTWLNTVLAVCEYMSFAKSSQEEGCSSQAETWQVKSILMKDFD